MNNEIIDDITRWSDQKLKTWIKDSVDRYEMAGLDPHRAFLHTTVNLMVMVANVLSTTDATPEESGWKLVESIRLIRKELAFGKRSANPN
jgi:hypothetical protein